MNFLHNTNLVVINNLPDEYQYISRLPLRCLESKHIAKASPIMTARRFEFLSQEVGYQYCYMSNKSDSNPKAVAEYVYQMILSNFSRPIKIVLTSDGRIWTDNTHTGILNLYCRGWECMICQTAFYLVDLRKEKPTLILADIKIPPLYYQDIVVNACRIEDRILSGWRPMPIRYSLGDLYRYDEYERMLNRLY